MIAAILPERIKRETTARNVSLSAPVGRGEGRGEVRADRAKAPPHPRPLLRFAEEREKTFQPTGTLP